MPEELLRFSIWIFGKLFSARFLALVMLITTFCFMVYGIVNIYLTYLTNPYFVATGKDIPTGIKELLLVILTAFISTINTVIAFYFLRNDRTQVSETK